MAVVFCRGVRGLRASATTTPQNMHPPFHPAAAAIPAANKLLSDFLHLPKTAKKFVPNVD